MSRAAPSRTLRLAHRGDWRGAPENSLAAMLAAETVPGCDGVELDIRLSRDGVPIAIHDETLARVQHRPERAADLDAATLHDLGVPSLAEVLAALRAETWLDLELKGAGHGQATAAALRAGRGDEPERALVSSFDPGSLAAMRRLLPRWPRWLIALDLSARSVALARELECRAIAVRVGGVTARAVGRAREAGIDVAAWTIRDPATAAAMVELGLSAICVEGEALDAP